MRKVISLLAITILSLLSPFVVNAYYTDPGSAFNPIYVNVTPSVETQNMYLESSVRAACGSYYSSCYSANCLKLDIGNPYTKKTCLSLIEYCCISTQRSDQERQQYLNSQNATLSCPVNSSVVSGSCQCNRGYFSYNGGCLSGDDICRMDFGRNSKFSGNVNSKNELMCDCLDGYMFDETRTFCQLKTVPEKPKDDTLNQQENKQEVVPIKKEIPLPVKVKEAATPSVFIPPVSEINDSLSANLLNSTALRECPTKSCRIIRYYAETATVRVIGLSDDNSWFKIEAKDDYGNPLIGWMSASAFNKDVLIGVQKILTDSVASSTNSEMGTSTDNQKIEKASKPTSYGIIPDVINFFKSVFSRLFKK